jgi:hypothetical protein
MAINLRQQKEGSRMSPAPKRPYVLEFVRYVTGFAAIIAIALFALTLASKAMAQ